MQLALLTMISLTAFFAKAQMPSSVVLEEARDYRMKIIKMWAGIKYEDGCTEVIKAAETNRFEVATTNALVTQGHCDANASYTEKCFTAFDGSDVAKKYAAIANGKCKLRSEKSQLPAATSVCNPTKNSKQMESLKNNTWCKQEVSCSNRFSIAGKDFDKGDYSFFCKPDEVGNCPNSFFGCKAITHTAEKGFFGGYGDTTATGSAAQ